MIKSIWKLFFFTLLSVPSLSYAARISGGGGSGGGSGSGSGSSVSAAYGAIYLSSGSVTQSSISTTTVKLSIFDTEGDSEQTTVSAANDSITVTTTSVFNVFAHAYGLTTVGAGEKYFNICVNGSTTPISSKNFSSSNIPISIDGVLSLTSGDVVTFCVRTSSIPTGQTITFSDAQLVVSAVGGSGGGGGGSGDITDVTAGVGLVGGGTTGSVTLSLDPSATNYIQNIEGTGTRQTPSTIWIDSATINGPLTVDMPEVTGLFASRSSLFFDPSSANPYLKMRSFSASNSGADVAAYNYLNQEIWRYGGPTQAASGGFSIKLTSGTDNSVLTRYQISTNGKHLFSGAQSNDVVEFDPVGNSSFTIPVYVKPTASNLPYFKMGTINTTEPALDIGNAGGTDTTNVRFFDANGVRRFFLRGLGTNGGFTIGASTTTSTDAISRIRFSDQNDAAKIIFNENQSGGFETRLGTMTFDSGSDDPVLDWRTDGTLKVHNGTFSVVERLLLPSLTSKNCLGTDSLGGVITGTCSGGGSGSPLEVFSNFDGINSSPTLSISAGDAFKLSVTGSTAVFTADSSSITLQGQFSAGTGISLIPTGVGYAITNNAIGSGASSLAVGTGTISAYQQNVSSPTSILNLDRDIFNVTLTGGTTAFITARNAQADGSQKGVSAYTAADFNDSAGVISIDYGNGQQADGIVPGFLNTTDWNTFNNGATTANSHGSRHIETGADPILGTLLSAQKVAVTTGTSVIATSSVTAFVAGSNMTITAEQNTSSTTIRFSATGGGGGGGGYNIEPASVTIKATQSGIVTSTLAYTGNRIFKSENYTSGAGVCQQTNGCTNGVRYQTATSSTNYVSAVFTKAATSYWQVEIPLPQNYPSISTITVQIIWTSTGTSGDVSWYVDAKSVSDDDTLDGSWGTAVEITDTNTASGDFLKTAESSTITIANTPTGGDDLFIRLYRAVGDTSDTYGGDARFVRMIVYYPIDNASSKD